MFLKEVMMRNFQCYGIWGETSSYPALGWKTKRYCFVNKTARKPLMLVKGVMMRNFQCYGIWGETSSYPALGWKTKIYCFVNKTARKPLMLVKGVFNEKLPVLRDLRNFQLPSFGVENKNALFTQSFATLRNSTLALVVSAFGLP